MSESKATNLMDDLDSNKKILLIDDEQVVLDVGTLMLEKLGYKVLQATNGMEATQVFKDNVDVICLVILDLKLPDEDGSDTCKRLKNLRPDMKIIHTSGFGRAQGDESLNCGCGGFLAKPFKIEELSHKLKDLLENTK